jgi:hypothetical protein
MMENIELTWEAFRKLIDALVELGWVTCTEKDESTLALDFTPVGALYYGVLKLIEDGDE